MKKFLVVAFGLLVGSVQLHASDLVEEKEYKEYLLFLDSADVTVTFESDRYRGSRPITNIVVNEISDSFFVVDQEPMYYTMEAIYPPLSNITLTDSASVNLSKELRYVRLLVPANLNVSVANTPDPLAFTCQAYWSGFIYNPATDSCVSMGASGCSQPFEYTTLDQCEVGYLLK